MSGLKKWVYIARGTDLGYAEFASAMRNDVASKLLSAGAEKLKLTVTEEPPPKAIFPFKHEPFALFCVWGDAETGADRFTEILKPVANRVSGYEVDESVPRDYDRTWPDGEVTPTPVTINILHRKKGLSDAQFIDAWHLGHTPLSFKVHPLWYYVRNVVTRPLWEGSEPADGIVEEACRTKKDLLTPSIFFKGKLMMIPNMIRVQLDIMKWMDMKKFEIFYGKEYHLKS